MPDSQIQTVCPIDRFSPDSLRVPDSQNQTRCPIQAVDACLARVGSMLTLFFTSKKQVSNYNDALECDTKMYAKYFKLMLDMGIYLPPSQYESLFLSSVMTDDDITKLIKSNKIALEKLKYE